jgi:hypothetical protein
MQIRYVPKKYKTLELFKTIRHYNAILKYTPHNLKTYEICLDAVKRRYFDLKYVPRKYKTLELCLTSLLYAGNCIRYIPKIFKTSEFYHLAVADDPWTFLGCSG